MRAFSPLAILIAVSLGASACGTDSESAVTAALDAAPEDKPEPIIQALPGKPTAPIRLTYALKTKPVIGEPLEIDISAATPLAGELTLTLATRAELILGQNQPERIDLGEQVAGAEKTHVTTVTVVPQAEGRSFLLVTAAAPAPEGQAMRLLSVPVQVGDVQRKFRRDGVPSESGPDAVISLPADETG